MVAAAQCGVVVGLDGMFIGKDDLELADFTLAKLGAHDAREGADARLFDMGHAEAGWIEFVACAHRADDTHARALGAANQLELGGHGIDRIDDVIILRQIHLIGGIRHIKYFISVNFDVGVDVVQALLHRVHFVLADGFARGDELAVEVGEADAVIVVEVDCADAAAHKSFRCIAAHAADAENRYTAGFQMRHGGGAEHEFRSGKLIHR